ncbi:MAG: IclR family transcriptional regulator [Streptosporangiaceae bacterium]
MPRGGAPRGGSEGTARRGTSGTHTVRTVDRAIDLLELMCDVGGEMGLSELSAASGLPLPTTHRLMRTLTSRGLARREPSSRNYALGPRLIRLGEAAGRMLGDWAKPYLAELVEATGETANLAMFDGDEAVYVAQAPSRHAMRMFTEVGRRVMPHCTGVGKALLSQLPDAEVRELLRRTGMPSQTPHTIADMDALLGELEHVRGRGFALDDGEQEVGVRCVAVPVLGAPTMAAISVSGPATRLTETTWEQIAPVMKSTAARLADALTSDAG